MSTVRKTVLVDGLPMSYLECGSGPLAVFLHGNPTSSYLWRNVMPGLRDQARCVAVDLVGMGHSGKLPQSGPTSYMFADHRRYLDGVLDGLSAINGVTFIGHDWGAVLAMDWARRHPDSVRGIAYLETLTAPVASDGPNAPNPAVFNRLRSPEGEDLVLTNNFFIETVLPSGTQRKLSDADMTAYCAPYTDPGESRRPMLSWAQQIPIDRSPTDVHDVVLANRDFMRTSPVPKLFINAEPGALLTADLRDECRTWPNQTEVTVAGVHFLPEDSPQALTDTLRAWLPTTQP